MKLGWGRGHTDEQLLPIMKQLSRTEVGTGVLVDILTK